MQVQVHIYIYICYPAQRSTKSALGVPIIALACPNHPNHFGIIFDSGWDARSKVPGRDSWAIWDLGSQPESKMIPK